MPLQQLVEYFNDRFGLEHKSSFRPILLEEGKASGLFGPVRINSQLLPLYQPSQPKTIRGYTAQLGVSLYDPLLLKHQQIESLIANAEDHCVNFDSIINFDRLARTVHLLNYLPFSHLEQTLFLEVDPRHILSVKNDHGAYFQEIITKCGLQTRHVVIVVGISPYFIPYEQALKKGLNNYRAHGYQIGIKLNFLNKDHPLFNHVSQIAPDFICLSANNMNDQGDTKVIATNLSAIKLRISDSNGSMLLLNVTDQKIAQLAIEAEVDLVGGYYYLQ